MASVVISLIVLIGDVAEAITETIVTPTPGLGHGRIADIVATALWIYSLIPS